MNDLFRTFASGCAEIAGSAWVFIVVVVLTVIGAVITFATGFETWGLIVDPIIAATTFYLVILLQNSQNRDTKAMQLKLDELIRGVEGARTGMVDLENLSDDEMNRLQREFQRLREGHNNSDKDGAEAVQTIEDTLENRASDAQPSK